MLPLVSIYLRMLGSQEDHTFVFPEQQLDQLSVQLIIAACEPGFWVDTRTMLDVQPMELSVNSGLFRCEVTSVSAAVQVVQENGNLRVSCDLPGQPGRLTPAEATVLLALLRREDVGVFFRASLRQQMLRRAATAYGLEHEPDLDRFLAPVYRDGRLTIEPSLRGLLAPGSPKLSALAQQASDHQRLAGQAAPDGTIAVISRHKYYRHPIVELLAVQYTKAGRPKPPFNRLQPLDLAAAAEYADDVKFFAAVARLQQVWGNDRINDDLESLRTVLKKGGAYTYYYHDEELGENFSSKSLLRVNLAMVPDTVCLSVAAEGPFYTITASMTVDERTYALADLPLKCGCFFLLDGTLFLIGNPLLLSTVSLLREQGGRLLIHASRYRDFHRNVLDKLADSIRVVYPGLNAGTEEQLSDGGFSGTPERLLYLSDFGNHVMIVPVVRYGEAEVAIRTEKQLKSVDSKGNEFLIPRDPGFEEAFLALLTKQHPHFPEQLDNQLYYLYLHKKWFLDEEWFLPAFETWRNAGIEVYGFNELTGNKLNSNRIQVDIKVSSGLNWFNATYDIRFGKKKASLKKIEAALRNKRNYVVLDDGTRGILPAEWIEKFAGYFRAGEVVNDETLRLAKYNFEAIATLYDNAMLEESARSEIAELRGKLGDVKGIPAVREPAGLRTTLRPYQRQGLGWLHFLDALGSGGILADGMGLGKTVQIVAFILSQREAGRRGTELVVVPATLIFNWQRELAVLAPSLRVLTLYGAGRNRSVSGLEAYDVVLTSYTTLLADIRFLKHFRFNYVYLDESQQVKNSESQRYRAVRLLEARNRIAISGTPFENSSFDLYGQLSFACPGLLGDRRYFRDVYGKPIDQFKNQKRRKELQRIIQPFILRRTKQEVAAELPEKYTAILYCEMTDPQRKIYDAYEKEFRDFICALSGDELDKNAMNVLRGLTRLRQICNSPALLPDGMLNTAVSAKIELLREQICDKAPYHKIVVFSQFVSMLRLISGMLDSSRIPHVSLTGNTRNREEVVNTFQRDPAVRVFLISLKAGGTGLNLTAANVVYLVDPWWNPAVEEQAIDRVHRIGQDRKVMAYRLITPDTVEEKVLQLQAAKNTVSAGLLDGDAPVRDLLIRDFLSPKKQHKKQG